MDALVVSSAHGLEDLAENAMEVWDLIPPERNSLVKLRRLVYRNKRLCKVLTWDQRRYVDALMLARWDRIRSLLVLRILAPIVKKLLNAVGKSFKASIPIECKATLDKEAIKGALSLKCDSAYRMIKDVAQRISRVAQAWGNILARRWPEDPEFIKYLMAMSLPQNNNRAFTLRL